MATNPRTANGARRKALRLRLKAEARPCWICVAMGKSAATARIDYSLPKGHPYAFEADELVPVSKYWLGGYPSASAAALDYNNLAAAHRCCNQWRSNKTVEEVMQIARGLKSGRKPAKHDTSRDWSKPPIVVKPSRDWRHYKPKQ